jgi:hypothetical protein
LGSHLIGDIALDKGEPKVHAHVVVGKKNGAAMGGHLLEAHVRLFGYYEGGQRLPYPNDGNIFCAAFSKGWFWYIPLSPTLTSVGAVIGKDHASALRQGHEAAMDGRTNPGSSDS